MTEEQKLQAVEKAISEYRASMAELKRQFNADVAAILERSRQRKLGEIRQKIASHGR
jgi:hypothetical protein